MEMVLGEQARALSIPRLNPNRKDILLYTHVSCLFCSECANLIHVARFGDFVVKPAYPPWVRLENAAIEEAAAKRVAIIEENDLFDARGLAFGKHLLVAEQLAEFVRTHPDHTLHIRMPGLWHSLPHYALEELLFRLRELGVSTAMTKVT